MSAFILVGGGHIHAPGFIEEVKKRGHRWAGVWDHDADRAARRSEKMDCPAMELGDLLASNFDAIVICSETRLHRELVEKIAPLGKPLFVEKPMGMNAADSAAIASLIKQAGVPFSTGYFRRGDANTRALRELIQSGQLGTVTRARFSNCHSGALGGWFDTEWRWMADLNEAGVGAFGDLGTHVLDLLLWFFGEPERVVGTLKPGANRYPGCEEYGEALLEYGDGMVATLAAGWNDVADPAPIQIMGTKGHAIIFQGKLYVKAGDSGLEVREAGESVAAGFPGFITYVEGGEAELVSPDEALARDRSMDAIYRSNSAGTWQPVS